MLLHLLLLFTAATLSFAELYCIGNENDMNDESKTNPAQFTNNGWILHGDARVSSKTSFNLREVSFDMDVSLVSNQVNTNLYTTSPTQPNCGSACYCDIQKSSSGKPSCMELDLLENNGKCLLATTLHTFATDGTPNNRNCDRWGCGSTATLPSSGKFHIRSTFGDDGSVTVFLDGVQNNQYSPQPSDSSKKVVQRTMASVGAGMFHSFIIINNKYVKSTLTHTLLNIE